MRAYPIPLLIMMAFTIAISFTSAVYVDTGALAQNVDDCAGINMLNTTNAVYTLTQNVTSNSTCFSIRANNITLIGAGYSINYSANGTLGHAINVSGFNSTMIRDASLYEGISTTGSKHAISFSTSQNITISNINVRTVGTGSDAIRFVSSTRVAVHNSSINVLAEARGIQLTTTTNIAIVNTSSLHTQNAPGAVTIRMSSGVSHLILNGVRFQSTGPSLDFQGSSSYTNITVNSSNLTMTRAATNGAIEMAGNNLNLSVVDSILDSASNNFYITSAVRGGTWNFTNVSENSGNSINSSWATGANGTLYNNWYLRANVSDFLSSSPLEGANVSVRNNAGTIQFSEIVGASGLTSWKVLQEYTRNDSTGTGPSIQYFSNYTVNATNLTYVPYLNSSINLTANTLLIVTMAQEGVDAIFPEFSNFEDNNGSVIESGIAQFNVTVENTNGTVMLQINGTNYTASNETANKYNLSITLNGGKFSYVWHAFGNGSSHNLRTSDSFQYVVNRSDQISPQISVIGPNYTRYHSPSSMEFRIMSNESLSSCVFSLNNWVTNYTMSINSSLNGANYTNNSLFSYHYTAYNASFACVDLFENVNMTSRRSFEITYPGVCGNNIVEIGEVCDGTDLNGLTCTTVAAGLTSGTLGCKLDCSNYNIAQCVAGGSTINAASCSAAHVQAAIDSAADGDTVNVPGGQCTWVHPGPLGAGAVSLTKSIILKGAGINATNITVSNITGSNDVTLSVSTSSAPFMISGFTFAGPGNASHIRISGGINFRITNISNIIHPTNPPRLIFVSTGNTYGLVDHINFDNNVQTGGMLFRMEDGTAHINGTNNNAWRRPLTLGTVNAAYLEDIDIYSNGTVYMFGTDSDNGGRIVLRHSRIVNAQFGSHGAQSSGGRGIFSFEVYNNTFILNDSDRGIWARGGTGVIFNNIIQSADTAGAPITVDTPRATGSNYYPTFDDPPNGSGCNVTSSNPWDGNEGEAGYPCLDQIGRSTGDPRNQILIPTYEWNNTFSSGEDINITVVNPPSDLQIVKSRDYYDDAQMPGYVSYPYPHYLQTIFTVSADTSAPIVTLSAPINGTNTSIAITSFNATFLDDVNISNATLFVWNSTGQNINQTSRALSGTTNSSNITFSFPHNGTFQWNYLAYDNSSNGRFATANFTINYTVVTESEDSEEDDGNSSSGSGSSGGGGGGGASTTSAATTNSSTDTAEPGIEGSLGEGDQNIINGVNEAEEDPSEFIGSGAGNAIISSIRDLFNSIRPTSRNYIVWIAVTVSALIAGITLVLHGHIGARHVVRKKRKRRKTR